MAGTTRYVRYILIAFVTLVVVLFLSGSSKTIPVSNHLQSAGDLLKNQGIWAAGSAAAARLKGNGAVPVTTPLKDDTPKPKGEAVPAPYTGASSPAEEKVASPNPYLGSDPSSEKGSSDKNTSPNPFVNPSSGQAALPPAKAAGGRMNATFVTLARNHDVWEISRSIRQVEDRFNRKYNYDWVFLNDADFDDTFKEVTTALTSGKARYGKIDKSHWGFPDFIDQDKAKKVREDMHARKIIYGDSISYRHMCRYESGFFFRHELMNEYEWYWRVEPSIELYCDIDYDPFVFMEKNKKKYSFVISLYEYIETIPTLWDSVKKFMKQHPEHIAEGNSMDWLSDDGGESYNHCHFWSNFEIGNLNWLRSPAYLDFFNFLDKEGGFFYERWGDAPVHSIAAGLMLKKDELHFFNDIAYYHVPFTHCPTGTQIKLDNKCHCNPNDNFDWNGYSCTAKWYDVNHWERPAGWDKEQGQ